VAPSEPEPAPSEPEPEPENKSARRWLDDEDEPSRKFFRTLIERTMAGTGDESLFEPQPMPVPQPLPALPPLPSMADVDETDESLFVPQPLPPLPALPALPAMPALSPLPSMADVDETDESLFEPREEPSLPREDSRPIARPKPIDSGTLFKNAGLMREIGGVDGFARLVKGSHRFVED
jgi:hypothetical protein